MKPLVLINRGGGSADPQSADKIRSALQAAGVEAEIAEVAGDEIQDRAREATERGSPMIVAAGGDGTISAVAAALAGSQAVLGILPLGTLNHFARDLGIPLDLDEACRILTSGRSRRVDVASLNDRPFLNNSAVGLYPLMVIDRDAQQARLGRNKKVAMVAASIRALIRFRHHRLTLVVDDAERTLTTPLLFVGNNDYRLDLAGAGKRESLSEGQLCVLVLRARARLGLFATLFRALAGRVRNEDMVRIDDVQRLRVDSQRSHLAVSLDGEVLHLAPPLDYRIQPGALTVVAP